MAVLTHPLPPVPRDEEARLRALADFRVAGTGSESQFDEITKLMSAMLNAPMSIVSLIDRDKQWIKASVGLGVKETPRQISFCAHTIASDGVFIVSDALKDQRFSDNPLVKHKPHLRFYAGAPLVTSDGHKLGALCVLDTKPRQRFDAKQELILKNFADLVMTHLTIRRDRLKHR